MNCLFSPCISSAWSPSGKRSSTKVTGFRTPSGGSVGKFEPQIPLGSTWQAWGAYRGPGRSTWGREGGNTKGSKTIIRLF